MKIGQFKNTSGVKNEPKLTNSFANGSGKHNDTIHFCTSMNFSS